MKKLLITIFLMTAVAVGADEWENKCETHCDKYGNCTTKCTYDDNPGGGCFIASMIGGAE